MRKFAVPEIVIILLIAVATASALPKSTSYQGKEYYVVTSTDSSEDTGNEVCAKVGKTCIGYTGFTTDTCRQLHPGAAVISGVDGSKTGFYCDGTPQGGVCGRTQNSCMICPACNVNADCSTQIGDLYREMYVECSSSSGPQQKHKTIYDFLETIDKGADSEINKKIPDSFKKLVGTNLFQVYIKTGSGTQYVWVETKDGIVTGSGRGRLISPSPTAKIEVSEQTIERILNSANPSAETQNAIKTGEIKIEFLKTSFGSIMTRFGIGFVRIFGGSAQPIQPQPLPITDNSGKDTQCNVKWDGPKAISCNGPYQAPGTGYGQNCCELDCNSDAECDEQAAGSLLLKGQCGNDCKFYNYQSKPVFPLPNPKDVIDPRIGQHPGNVVCEFYQITKPDDSVKSNHKHATCAAYKTADHFCVIAMQSQYARAVKCEEQGIIVCTNPCKPETYQLPIKQCAFEGERPRGYNAPPLEFCDGPYTGNVGPGNPPQGKKNPGEVCAHGGECRTSFCVGVGQGPPWTYQCSCNAFRYETGC